jgi:hypothetical protein
VSWHLIVITAVVAVELGLMYPTNERKVLIPATVNSKSLPIDSQLVSSMLPWIVTVPPPNVPVTVTVFNEGEA